MFTAMEFGRPLSGDRTNYCVQFCIVIVFIYVNIYFSQAADDGDIAPGTYIYIYYHSLSLGFSYNATVNCFDCTLFVFR